MIKGCTLIIIVGITLKYEIMFCWFIHIYCESNKLKYSRSVDVGVKHLESFERDELELIFSRSGLTILNINVY